MKQRLKIIIGGGGTGGHVFPAIAIANAIKKLEPDTVFHFVGAKGKLEMEKVPKAGYQITGLWISGFQRKITLKNLMVPVKLIYSLWSAFKLLKSFKPTVVIGVGGYASGPVLNMANRMGIPTVLQEQNSYAGVTNKILAQKAKLICVAYDEMEHFFPKEKILLTGNPVREDLKHPEFSKAQAIASMGLADGKKTLFVFGGSLGARTINNAMAASTEMLRDATTVQVIWQIGNLYWEQFKDCNTARLPNVKAMPFVDRMDIAYMAADLVVCRSGALAISELCVLGKPAILVPSPNVAEDHQTKNAMALVHKEAAILVKDNEAEKEMVAKAIQILHDQIKLELLSKNIKKLSRPDADLDIAKAIIQLAKQ